jgi:hypothetical protein
MSARLLLLIVLGFAGACSHQVGDGCSTNVECSPLGDRFCDLSSPGGYCTIEGCDSISCPSGSVCIRFFSLQRGAPQCDPSRVPRTDCQAGSADCCQPGSAGCCRLGERCLSDDAQHSYCASETSEHRWCMHVCNSQSDCRDGYQCYSTDQGGAIAVTVRDDMGVVSTPVASYCAPLGAN